MIRIVKCRDGVTEMFFNEEDAKVLDFVVNDLLLKNDTGLIYTKHPFGEVFGYWLHAVEEAFKERRGKSHWYDEQIGMIRKRWNGHFDCEMPFWGIMLNREEFEGHVENYAIDSDPPTFDEILG